MDSRVCYITCFTTSTMLSSTTSHMTVIIRLRQNILLKKNFHLLNLLLKELDY